MRIRPLEMSEWSPKILEKLAGMARSAPPKSAVTGDDRDWKEGRALPGMLKTVAHHPELMDPFLDFS